MTGTGTLSAIARVSGMSKPWRVPSRSIDVSSSSPAPSETTSCAYSIASIPVALRPPWVNISQRSEPPARLTRFASMATTTRRSTKLTPLTTRPSLTSRQGITRTLNIVSSSTAAFEPVHQHEQARTYRHDQHEAPNTDQRYGQFIDVLERPSRDPACDRGDER